MNNRKLLLILIVLAFIFAGVFFLRNSERGKSFRKDVPEFDSASVTEILLNPRAEKGQSIRFFKKEGSWRLSKGELESAVRENTIETMLSELQSLRIDRLASRNKSKWAEFQVSDTNGSRVRVKAGDKDLFDFYVGKFDFESMPGKGQNALMSGGGLEGSTFIRFAGEEETYIVRGFLNFTFNGEFNNWRDSRFLEFAEDTLVRIEYVYPGEASFVLEKKDSVWMLGEKPAHPATLNKLVRVLSFRQNSDFFDAPPPSAEPERKIMLSSSSGKAAEIKAWKHNETEWILWSSQHPEVWFKNSESGIAGEIFLSREEAIKGKERMEE